MVSVLYICSMHGPSLTNANHYVLSEVRLNRHEICRNDPELVIVNGENKSRVGSTIDESQQISHSLLNFRQRFTGSN